jgi:hypothetical protein
VVFSWSYRTLTPHAAGLFRLLGIHPGPDIGLDAATSLAGIPRSRVRGLLTVCSSSVRSSSVDSSTSHTPSAKARRTRPPPVAPAASCPPHPHRSTSATARSTAPAWPQRSRFAGPRNWSARREDCH